MDTSDHNPFPGLRPFEYDESYLFFGRDGQSTELLRRLGVYRFAVVAGTSSSGKSSLVRAGLLPALYGGMMAGVGSGWRVAILRPGGDPVQNLAHALSSPDVLGTAQTGADANIEVALAEATLRRTSFGLVDLVRQARMPPNENLLIIVDQFEELFRYMSLHRGRDDEATAFVSLLLTAMQQRDLPIYVVLTLRSDFLGDCAHFWNLSEALNAGLYLVPRMTREECREAIAGPVAVGGGRITPPLVNRLLNDMGDNPDQLPILQHALMRTWDYWFEHRRYDKPLDIEHYEGIGGMSQALAFHADEAFDELPGERGRMIAETMFKALTERGTDNRVSRRPTRLQEICEIGGASAEAVIAVVDVFRREGRSFIMPPSGFQLRSDTVIDISHESLVRNWPRLRNWVEEEADSARSYRRLAENALLHDNGSAALLIDPELQFALDWQHRQRPNHAWARRYAPDFERAMRFLDESRERRELQEAEKERYHYRSLRQTRSVAVALVMMALLLFVLTVYSYRLRIQSEARRVQAEEQRREAVRLRDEMKSIAEQAAKAKADSSGTKR